MGLHRDDIKPLQSPFQRELRKQLWWTLYAFEKMQVSSYDRPSGISDAVSSASYPNERLVGCATYPISRGTEVNMVIFIHDPNHWEGENAAKEVPQDDMLADLQGFDRRFIASLQDAKPVKWPLFHHPDTPIYYLNRVCLLGDAAHASSPSQAAGAGQGLEDALILSRLLSLVHSPDHIETAFSI
ncbi:hypothetical protein BJX63DRAFT_274783 [Aspergillus granulosus]|uniref:Uncharacterized protein n=1 Tax=Aspergillus granulosus TaxID=176169 RepID=A0ABR4H859_9EURO